MQNAADLLPPSLAPRGLSRSEAAAYIGVSPNLFDAMVKDGRMEIGGTARPSIRAVPADRSRPDNTRRNAPASPTPIGGRGLSAAAVTPRDAANLLIAIAASPLAGPTVKEAVRTCEAYGSLKELERVSLIERFPKFGLPTLASLPAGHSLREALSVLIDAAGKGETFQIPDREGPLTADFCFVVQFEGPEPWAEILADGSLGEGKPSQMARLVYTSGRMAKGLRKRRPAGAAICIRPAT
jgi:hypothetical protein